MRSVLQGQQHHLCLTVCTFGVMPLKAASQVRVANGTSFSSPNRALLSIEVMVKMTAHERLLDEMRHKEHDPKGAYSEAEMVLLAQSRLIACGQHEYCFQARRSAFG